MDNMYKGGLPEDFSGGVADHLNSEQYSAPVDPNCGPVCMTPKATTGTDETSGSNSYTKSFLQDANYDTGFAIRAEKVVPTEITWNKMK